MLSVLTGLGCSPAGSESGGGSAEASESGTSGSLSESSSETSETQTETGGDTPDPQACWTDLGIGETEVFYSGFSDGSEGVAFGADGQLYVTTIAAGEGTVWRFDAEGNPEAFANLPYALGLAPLADGGFVVASLGLLQEPDGAVYRVDAQGEVSELLGVGGGIGSPNFVTMAPDGSALISDDVDTRVFRVTMAGELSVVIENVPSPNGMAYSPDGSRFYVASTFTPQGQLTRYDVVDGFPVEDSAVEILQLGPTSTPDGIAVDVEDRVYVLANLPGEIWRVDGSATELQAGELVVGGLFSPASAAFGMGPDFDPCSLYVSSLTTDRVTRVHVGVRGAM